MAHSLEVVATNVAAILDRNGGEMEYPDLVAEMENTGLAQDVAALHMLRGKSLKFSIRRVFAADGTPGTAHIVKML